MIMAVQKIHDKTLEQLERDYWKEPTSFPTKLVENVFSLRKVPIKDLDCNDIRILLSQNVGLQYLVPEALNYLEKNILEESLYYPGDLLLSVLRIDAGYWQQNKEIEKDFSSLLKNEFKKLSDTGDLDDDVKKEIIDAVSIFLKAHN